MLALPIEYSAEVCGHQSSEVCKEKQCASFQQQNQEFECLIKGMNHYLDYNVSVIAKNAVGKIKSDAVAVFLAGLFGEFLRPYMLINEFTIMLLRLNVKMLVGHWTVKLDRQNGRLFHWPNCTVV